MREAVVFIYYLIPIFLGVKDDYFDMKIKLFIFDLGFSLCIDLAVVNPLNNLLDGYFLDYGVFEYVKRIISM